MRIGSITKHFTALIPAPVRRRRGGARRPSALTCELHAVARGVTARQLLGNVSGLRDAFDLSLQFSGPGKSVSMPLLASTRLDDTNAVRARTWSYNTVVSATQRGD